MRFIGHFLSVGATVAGMAYGVGSPGIRARRIGCAPDHTVIERLQVNGLRDLAAEANAIMTVQKTRSIWRATSPLGR
jgi:hypothetical protein